MARPKEFDVDSAVAAAVEQFREHGYEGTSAQMLVAAMGIGRQSLYDTFGDKWGVYLAAVKLYSQQEVRAHGEALASHPRAIDGIRAMFDRVVEDAGKGCLGIGATVEFGCSRPDLVKIREGAQTYLSKVTGNALIQAREQGDIAPDLDLDALTAFLVTTISSIRLAARAGAAKPQLAALVNLAMRALH